MQLKKIWKKFLAVGKPDLFNIIPTLFFLLLSVSFIACFSRMGSSQASFQENFCLENPLEKNVKNQFFVQSPSTVVPISLTYPQPVLSLGGTLGSNGWYISDVEVTMYPTESDFEDIEIEYSFFDKGWSIYVEPFIIFEEGQTGIYYRVKNDSGFVGDTKYQAVDIDKTPPIGSIFIEKDADEIFSTNVNLNLLFIDEPSGPTTPPPSGYIWGVPSGPADMRFSNDAIIWSPWEPISANKSWTLDPGAGNKTVYVQARDNAGLASEIFSDGLYLIVDNDFLPPVTEISLSGKKTSNGIYTADVVIILSATDDLSGVNIIEYSFDNINWNNYTGPFYVSSEGQTTIYYRTQDVIGNIESTKSQTIEINRKELSDLDLNQLIIAGLVIISLIIIVTIAFRRRRSNLKETI